MKFTFHGTVQPAGTWHRNEPLVLNESASTVTISMQDGQLELGVLTPAGVSLDEIKVEVQEIATAFVDAFAFHIGLELRAELTHAYEEGSDVGTHLIPGRSIESAYRVPGGAIHLPSSALDELTDAAIHITHARIALSDLQRALLNQRESAFYCYRAIESMRQYFLEGDDAASARRKSWETFRQVLGLETADLMRVKQAADPRRHGGTSSVAEEEASFAVGYSRRVFLRFIEYVTLTRTNDGPHA
jgi:hypothetical protein